jgi:hypothetical protein
VAAASACSEELFVEVFDRPHARLEVELAKLSLTSVAAESFAEVSVAQESSNRLSERLRVPRRS